MATVPRVTIPQTQVNPLPDAGSQRRNSLINTDAFGGALGGVQQELGQRLQTIGAVAMAGGVLLEERKNAVLRAEAIGEFRKNAKAGFLEIETKGNAFAEPEELEAYSTQLNDEMKRLLGDHKGSTGSRFALQEQLTRVRDDLQDAAVTRAWSAQRAKVGTQISTRFAELSETAQKGPSLIGSLMQEVEHTVDNYASVLTPEEAESNKKAGREQVVRGAMDSFMATGSIKEADKLLSESITIMSPELSRQYRNRITVQQNKFAEADAVVQNRLRLAEKLGIDVTALSDAKKLALMDVNVPSEPGRSKTALDEYLEATQVMRVVTGDPNFKFSNEEVKKKFGFALSSEPSRGPFGSGEHGLATARANELLPSILNRTASSQERLEYASALSIIAAENPVTGQRVPLLPIHQRGAAMLGIDPFDLSRATVSGGRVERMFSQPPAAEPTPAAPAPSKPSPQGAQPAPSEQQALDPSGQLSRTTSQAETFVEQNKATGVLGTNTPDPPVTLFGVADQLTGPTSSLKQGLSGTAVIGDFVKAPEVRQARRFFEAFKLDLARSLQNNPKFPVSEFERVLESLNLESKFFGNPGAFQQDLAGLSNYLEDKSRALQQDIAQGKVSREELRHATDAVVLIQKALRVIGAPPRFQTPEQVDAAVQQGQLQPGALFRDKRGLIRQVPAGAP